MSCKHLLDNCFMLFTITGAGLFAYIVGKWSYRNECREKILRLENSPLADSIRRGRGSIAEAMQDQLVL
jgi:Ovarian carcinoma immunoreactive antigen (OCIA)